MLVKIDNHIGEFFCLLFDESDHLVGRITNIVSLDNVRVQIKEQKLSGYYLLHIPNEFLDLEDKLSLANRIDITPEGRLDIPNSFEWPAEFLVYNNILINLIG